MELHLRLRELLELLKVYWYTLLVNPSSAREHSIMSMPHALLQAMQGKRTCGHWLRPMLQVDLPPHSCDITIREI